MMKKLEELIITISWIIIAVAIALIINEAVDQIYETVKITMP